MSNDACFHSFNYSKGQNTTHIISFEVCIQEANFHQNVIPILASNSFPQQHRKET